MKIFQLNHFFTFSAAESKLIQKAPSGGPETQARIETPTKNPDSNESKTNPREKAIKTIDKLSRLMSTMKNGDKVKPGYEENYKKLQKMQKKLQSRLENNTEIKKENLGKKTMNSIIKNAPGYSSADKKEIKKVFQTQIEHADTNAEKLAMNELKQSLQAISQSLKISDNAKNLAKIIQNNSNGKIAWIPATKIVIRFIDQLQNFTNDFVINEDMTAETFATRWENIQTPEIKNALKQQYTELYNNDKTSSVASNDDELTFEPDDVRKKTPNKISEVKISEKDKKTIKDATDALQKSPLNEQAVNNEFEKQYRQANSEEIAKGLVKITNAKVNIADLGFKGQIKAIRHNGKIIPVVDFDKEGKQYVTEFTNDEGNTVEKYIDFDLNAGDLIRLNTKNA